MEEHTHESFGQIYFGRISCTGENFYGSELEQSHYIQMELHSSAVQRDLSMDWYHTRNLLARVRMTSGQFAELITSLNNGSGTCCTVEYVGKKMEKLPVQESRKEFIHRRFEDRMKEFATSIRANQRKAQEIVKKKTLSKQDIHDLTHQIEWLTGEVERNIPFFAKCFQENMDEVVLEAKTEVENAIQHKISVLGLNALHEQNKLLTNENNNNGNPG